MGFFSNLFSKGTPKASPRKLNHPAHLQQGDLITLDDSFALPAQLRGQSLQVTQVNTYEYEHSKQCEWVLQGSNDELLFMSIETDDSTSLVFSRKITRATVGEIFALDQFSTLFDEPGKAVLDTLATPTDLSQWLAPNYRQCEFGQFGYFHQGDKRQEDLSEQSGDSFERYSAISDDERFGVESEVYQDGETDVMVTLYRPLSDIREYWPHS